MSTPLRLSFWQRAGLCSAIALVSSVSVVAIASGQRANQLAQTPTGKPVQSVSQLSDVKPTDWAFTALQSLVKRYGCIAGYSDRANRNAKPISRYEFAAGLNACLDKINELVTAGLGDKVLPEDLAALQKLQEEFAAELATLRGRVDGLEAKTAQLQAQQFSTTTKLNATAIIGGSPRQNETQPLNGRVRLNHDISQAGKDRLRTRLQIQNTPANSQPASPSVSSPSAPLPARPYVTNGIIAPSPQDQGFNTEGYNRIEENSFQRVNNEPLSTFSIDVDTASYSNMRRFINARQMPPKDAVRTEELINYFTYNYPQPDGDRPFSVTTEVGNTPWNPSHKLVLVGLQGKRMVTEKTPPSNLVFLIDVSGSMNEENKLPLVKQSLRLLVNELSASDRVSMVVYAGNAGMVLPSTPGNQKAKILAAIDRLEAGGSTAGGAGIQLAYQTAKQHLLKDGNNRVILATDGDFNVGASSDGELVRMIEQKRDEGVFLTVLGFGTGNYKDSKMEQLADKGNGNYAYIDTILEAKKVLVNDLRATLFAIAKDVKIQVEFNPAKVQAYRLIGYENRVLQNQDFNDDKKDAGEIGAGHAVTALYEIIPTGIASTAKLSAIDPLKYQQPSAIATSSSNELMQVKLRYKSPKENVSKLITQSVIDFNPKADSYPSANFRFASAVATFSMVLRDSEHKGKASLDTVLKLASQAKGEDKEGYRTEFIRLVEAYKLMALSQSRL
jgi:Ca-activated chloride channel homolog